MGFLDTLGKIGSAITAPVSAIAGIGSSLISANSQEKANESNLQIAQMNNEWSERMMEKQHLYDVEMWNKNNEYNDPSKQVERLKAAGINPALALGNISTGSAQGGNSVGLPSASSATMQPINYNGIGTAINEAMQLQQLQQRTSAETNWMNTQSVVAKAKAAAEVAEIAERTRGHKFQNRLNEATESILAATRNEQYLNELQKRLNAGEQQKLMIQEGVLKRLQIEAFPQRLAMDVAVMASQIALNKHNTQSEVGKIMDTLKKKGYKLSKSEEKRIFDAVISSVVLQGTPDGWDNPKTLEYLFGKIFGE